MICLIFHAPETILLLEINRALKFAITVVTRHCRFHVCVKD